MAAYDDLINAIGRCVGNAKFDALQAIVLLEQSLITIRHLQDVVRQYNPDDALFDDEKKRTG